MHMPAFFCARHYRGCVTATTGGFDTMSSDSRSTDVPNERREYFRIEDTVYLDYRVLEEGEMPPAEAEQAWPEHLKVLNELSTVSRHVNAMVPKLREFYPDITQFLVALNQKVDLLVAL